jgi:hypothetical protein
MPLELDWPDISLPPLGRNVVGKTVAREVRAMEPSRLGYLIERSASGSAERGQALDLEAQLRKLAESRYGHQKRSLYRPEATRDRLERLTEAETLAERLKELLSPYSGERLPASVKMELRRLGVPADSIPGLAKGKGLVDQVELLAGRALNIEPHVVRRRRGARRRLRKLVESAQTPQGMDLFVRTSVRVWRQSSERAEEVRATIEYRRARKAYVEQPRNSPLGRFLRRRVRDRSNSSL